MKISLNWLKDYVTVNISKDELSHKLTMAGLEVEEITTVGDDTIFELEITPNRADCLSMIGMAREVATILSKPLKKPAAKKFKTPSKRVSIKIEDLKDCRTYIGTLLEGINVSSSSKWLKDRILSLGIRPINNLVDITNFCLMETGQPLHVFDYDKLDGDTIFVRRANKGEKIITIDDVERELDPSILIIADARKPIAIAGIMGGKETEVSSSTKNVLLEVAHFDPVLTRRACRKLGLSSDSSYRFERGVDVAGVSWVNQRAIGLILESAKGKIIQHGQSGAAKIKQQKAVTISLKRINSYLGTKLSAPKIKGILKRLEFSVTSSKADHLRVTPPSSRSDIKTDVDLIEEVARIIGYDQLPETMPNIQAANIQANPNRVRRNHIRECMISQGFDEVVSFSLLNRQDLKRTNLSDEKVVAITNPLSLDQEILQPSMLPALLSVVKTNLNRGQKNIKFFEIGKIYLPGGKEQDVLGIITTGLQNDDWRNLQKMRMDFYDLKGAVDQAFSRVGMRELTYKLQPTDVLKDQVGAGIYSGKQEIGLLGSVKVEILNNWSIKAKDIIFAQVAIPSLKAERKPKRFSPISEFPVVTRDISLALDQKVVFADIKNISLQEGGSILRDIIFCEEYLGEKIPEGQRGIIFSLIYQSNERTLTEEEVNEIHQKILKRIVEECKAIIR